MLYKYCAEYVDKVTNKICFPRRRKIKLIDQIIFLNELKAFKAIGNTDKINEYIPHLSNVELSYGAHNKEMSVGEKMYLSGFDKQVVALVRNGEKLGKLEESIQAAIRYCELLLDIKKNVASKVIFGFILFCVSLSGLFFIPSILSGTLKSFTDLGVSIKMTFATDILIFMSENHLFLWVGIFAIFISAGFLYIWREQFLDSEILRKIISPFSDYYASYRSLKFLVIWSVFRSVNIPLDREHKTLEEVLGERVYKKIKYRLIEGESLASAIGKESREFSRILISSIVSISYLPAENFNEMSSTLINLLRQEQKRQAEKLATAFNLIGSAIAVLTILLIVYGLIFPVLSVQATYSA